MPEAIFIRHGHTESTIEGIKGRSDVSLSEEGMKEMLMTGLLLSTQTPLPDRIVASPLIRARQSAQILNSVYKNSLPMEVSEDVNELDVGDWTGKAKALAFQEYEENWQTMHAESFESAQKRIVRELERLAQTGSKKIIVLSHSILMTLLYAMLPKTEGLPEMIPMMNGCGFVVSLEPVFQVTALFPNGILEEMKEMHLV